MEIYRNFVRRSGLFTEFFEAEWKFYGTELIRSAKLAGHSVKRRNAEINNI